MNRVLIIVDVSNLYYTVRKRYGDTRKVDYRKLLTQLKERGYIYRAICYSSEMKGKAHDFFNCLKSLGFELRTKAIKQYNNNGKIETKCNFDSDMIVDAIRFRGHYEELIMVSADGDFIPLIKYMQEQGIKTHVLACAINSDLRDIVDSCEEIGPALLERLNDSQENGVAATA